MSQIKLEKSTINRPWNIRAGKVGEVHTPKSWVIFGCLSQSQSRDDTKTVHGTLNKAFDRLLFGIPATDESMR